MNFASYNAFRVALQWLIEAEELTDSSFSTNTLDLMIGLAEERVVKGDALSPGLRASTMLVRFADVDTPLAVADNAMALPADWLELHEAYFSGKRPLDVVSIKELRTRENESPQGGTACWCAQDGDTLRFWPAVSDGPVLGSYYAKPESLKTIDWGDATTLARYPEVYLYAALYECALFLGHVKAPEWEARYRALVDGAAHNERARVYGGGSLRVRAR